MENPLVQDFLFYAALCIIKMFICVGAVVYFRMTRKVFMNPEDLKAFGAKDVKLNDEVVERFRRNHLNDMENVLPFVAIGACYCLINPSHALALWHFRIFFFSRVVHFISYQLALSTRGPAFTVGFIVMISMALQIVMATI